MADLILEDVHREELLAAGILGILSPSVEQVDKKITEVRCVCVCVSAWCVWCACVRVCLCVFVRERERE